MVRGILIYNTAWIKEENTYQLVDLLKISKSWQAQEK